MRAPARRRPADGPARGVPLAAARADFGWWAAALAGGAWAGCLALAAWDRFRAVGLSVAAVLLLASLVVLYR
ncbi:hypothetical protein AB0O22_02575 [Streptomyces sp. NPDC091204]|uniref:hypothetical protein n=1 Tax=Streptomyces sp. NPDC091204 TaxID=3155299 RepID=UPI003435D08A